MNEPKCGCRIVTQFPMPPEIVFCPLHAAAGRMEKALRPLLTYFGACHCHESYRVREKSLGYPFKDPDCSYCQNETEILEARAALEAAKGE